MLTVALGTTGLAFLFAAISFLSMHGTPAIVSRSWRPGNLYLGQLRRSGRRTWRNPLTMSFGLLFDPLSAVMLMVITGVGFLIHIYSAGYMHEEEDPRFWRYFSYLNFFIFAMVLLVSADNFLFLLVGWGLVGLASFLLIGFWYQRRAATVAAAQKALVINIIGDFGLMIAIFLIFKNYRTLNYFTDSNGNIGVFNQRGTSSLILPPPSACCSSWPVRLNRPSCRSTCGCPMRWKVRRQSAP